MEKFSVVIPVYGCKAALPELNRRLNESLKSLSDNYEIIYVDDNCPQNSWEEIEKICTANEHCVGIQLSRNFGQMKAILAGLDYCTGDWVIVMDCDLQDRPEDIQTLYKKAMEGYDAVFARRINRNDGKSRSLFAKLFYKFYEYATDCKYDPNICNFSIVKKSVIEQYCKMREQKRGYVMYIDWLGFKKAVVELEHDERFEGKSSYTFKKRLNYAFDLLTSQSDKILRLAVKLGFLITLLSVIAIIVLIVQYFACNVAVGWTSILATLCLMSGIIICVVGVVGIYVGNIFNQTKDRPLYVTRQVVKKNNR